MLIDGRVTSKLGGEFDHDPAASFDFGHFYFGSGTTPPAISLDKIAVRVNTYREIDAGQPYRNSSNTYVVRFQGCDDYSTATHTGTWVDLGFEIEGEPEKFGTSVYAAATVFAKRKVNAVRIMFDYMAGADTGNPVHQGYVHELIINGDTTKYVYVQTTDSTDDIGDNTKLYAPASHEKLRGGVESEGVGGSPRCYYYEIGAASEGAALSLARTALKMKLAQYAQRHYEYRGPLPNKPELGKTIAVDEDNDGVAEYTGVIRAYSVQVADPAIITTARVLDHNASVIE